MTTLCPRCRQSIVGPLYDHIAWCPAIRFALDSRFDFCDLKSANADEQSRKNTRSAKKRNKSRRGKIGQFGQRSPDYRD